THERLCAGKAPEPAPEPDESDEVVKTEQRRRRASARVIESGGIPEWVEEQVVRTTPEWPESPRLVPEWGNDLPRTSIWGDSPAWR
ncbi:MAG: hypothetical protein JWO38_6388, partial [Gemmataceae bacterium]|nr:hypothetical protein [Gemmataceae bacterium]